MQPIIFLIVKKEKDNNMKITASLSQALTEDLERVGQDGHKSRVCIYKATQHKKYSRLDHDITRAVFKISKITSKKRLRAILENVKEVSHFGMKDMNPESDWERNGIKDPYPYNKVISSCFYIIYHFTHNSLSSMERRYIPKYFVTVEGCNDQIFLIN